MQVTANDIMFLAGLSIFIHYHHLSKQGTNSALTPRRGDVHTGDALNRGLTKKDNPASYIAKM